MKDKFLDALLKNGFSTILAVLFCYFLFFIMELHQEKTEDIRRKEIELFQKALKIQREQNSKMLRELIECMEDND
tara:strand:- start:1899 stop:2123 length:225 start_codon:yes stop_codon:yes gene_type:complete